MTNNGYTVVLQEGGSMKQFEPGAVVEAWKLWRLPVKAVKSPSTSISLILYESCLKSLKCMYSCSFLCLYACTWNCIIQEVNSNVLLTLSISGRILNPTCRLWAWALLTKYVVVRYWNNCILPWSNPTTYSLM